MSVTRAWCIVFGGVVLIAAAGAGSLLLSRDVRTPAADTSPFPVGQTFTSTEWERVTKTLMHRGFDSATMRVASGMRLQSLAEPLALVRATSHAKGLCFIPVRGTRPGAATCSLSGHLEKPMLVYAASEHWRDQTVTDIVGVVRHSVVSVVMIDRRGFGAGVALIPSSGNLWSFAGGYGSARVRVQARTASGRIVSRAQLP